MLVAPSSQNTIDNSLAGWTFVGYGTNTSIAGRMSGNNSTDSSAVQVAGFSGTSTADFAVVGWSSSLAGADWAAVVAWWNEEIPVKTPQRAGLASQPSPTILLLPQKGAL
ncbi:MAG TPA: hypothetical protein VLT36_18390 [Candidatus Dormibacteraeota bacterium]|nr:hypothetical protein [Candidatus Dormibacteraeota bacterium]